MNNYFINENDNIFGYTPISLGWNCGPAALRANKYNFKKENGYLTMSF